MRVLFDIVHPADILFFYHAIIRLEKEGHSALILSRHKDVTCQLLDEFRLKHIPISSAASGTVKLAFELTKRDFAVMKHAWSFKPHIMVGFGGVAISHVGRMLNIPAISFYDTDTATLQNKITWPFITHLYVPDSYSGKTPKGRTSYFKGIKELAYFHPESFEVDEDKALKNGWRPEKDNFLIRTVLWRANHDVGKSGWSDAVLSRLVERLFALGHVHISSERPLPGNLEPLRFQGAGTELHHLMAKCKLYIGESLTMAQEAFLLGLPAIYDGHDVPSPTQDMINRGLIFQPKDKSEAALFSALDTALNSGGGAFNERRQSYVNAHPNLTDFIVAALHRHAKPS